MHQVLTRLSRGQSEALAPQIEMCSAEHLALEPLEGREEAMLSLYSRAKRSVAALGLSSIATLATLLLLQPLLIAAAPGPQQLSSRPLRLIVFSTDAATVVARARGLFAAEGLDVNIALTPSSTAQMRGLSAGTWEVASTAFDNVLAWSGREGAEIVAVLQTSNRVSLPIFVRPEIRDWPDLRGRRLAVDAVDTAFALVLRRVLLAHGLDLTRGDYELVPEGATGQRFESMTRGDTVAAILGSPWDQKASEAGLVRFGDHREALPDYPGGVLAVRRSWAKEHRDELVAFLRAWLAGARWALDPANREEALRLIATDQGLTPQAAAGRLTDLSANGALNLAGLQSVLDLRIRFGLTPPLGPSLSSYYDLEYYQAALGR
jgi:ABC-type nitrate/sulfonate/bicarbonate transport system substrate-binding protein